MEYEYKVVPAPSKGEKRKGLRSAEDRFAAALETAMNRLAGDGWEYVRCDTLPSQERAGLTQVQTVWRNLLVFRRKRAQAVTQAAPQSLAAPQPPRMIEPPRPDPAQRPSLRAVETAPRPAG